MNNNQTTDDQTWIRLCIGLTIAGLLIGWAFGYSGGRLI